jgi:hypothetical protein
VACTTERSEGGPEGATTLRLTVSTSGVTTRTTPTLSESVGTLASGSRIGVTVQKTDGTTYSLSDASTTNIPYQASGTGNSQTWSATAPITLTLEEARVSAYYPYQNNANPAAISITCTNSSPDWMYATWKTASTSESYISELYPDVALTLKHAQAAVAVTITPDGYTGPGKISKIEAKGFYGRSGTLNTFTGELSGVTKQAISETYSSPPASFTSPGYWTNQWFVLPMDAELPQTMVFVITIDGSEYRTISSATYEQGKIYRYNFTVNPVALELTSVVIDEWNTTAMTPGALVYTDPNDENEEKYSEGNNNGGNTGGGGSGTSNDDGVYLCDTEDGNYEIWMATMNVGAVTPEGYGHAFRFGETTPWTANMPEYNLTFTDNYVLTAAEDAATVYMGEPWRIPTYEEWDRILDQCTITFEAPVAKITGANGTDVVILPMPGMVDWNSQNEGEAGYYWSATYSRVIPATNWVEAYPAAYGVNFEYASYNSQFYKDIFEQGTKNAFNIRAIKLVPKS